VLDLLGAVQIDLGEQQGRVVGWCMGEEFALGAAAEAVA